MKYKRVLLVSSPFYRLMGSHYNGTNLGLCYISSVLIQKGIECCSYNADYLDSEEYSDQIRLIEKGDEYKKAISDVGHPIWHECVQNILNYGPDIVGFSMFTANFPAVKNLSYLLKQRSPDTILVAGGPHVTLAKQPVLKEIETLDFAIYGEGEYSFLEFVLGKPHREIRGLSYRNNGIVVVNSDRPFIKNLDELPFPKKDNFYPDTPALKRHFVITSRGCPNRCSFCASPLLWKQKVRFRTVENVITELKELKKNGFEYIQFLDDTFTYNKKRLITLLDVMIMDKMGFSWTCDTRLSCLDEEALRKMKEAGCIRVKVGIESGNKRILSKINKGITPDTVMERIKLIKKFGIGITAYFMIGFPGETNHEVRETIELAKKIGADYNSLSILAPYYGTEIYDQFVNSKKEDNVKRHWEYFYHQSKDMIMDTNISPDVINEFFKLNDIGKGIRI